MSKPVLRGPSMRLLPYQRGLTLFLVALLLPGSVDVPGMRHAHENGDRPHSHEQLFHQNWDQVGEHSEHNSRHMHFAQADESYTHAGSACTIAESTTHIHATLFGIPLTLPCRDSGTSDRHDTGPIFIHIFAAKSAVIAPECKLLDAL